MKNIPIKKNLYLFLTLFLCINLQANETSQKNTVKADTKVSPNNNNHVSLQNLNTDNSTITRGGRQQNHKPKQNNAASQNIIEAQNMVQLPNIAEPKNMNSWHDIPESQNNTGSFDPDFAGDKSGYVINTMGFKSEPRSVAIQENNKIVVAGVRDDYPVLARYNENGVNDDGTIGVLDKTFATAPYGPGVVIQTSLGKNSHFNAIAVNKLYQSTIAVGQWDKNKCLLVCYYDNGTLNTLFGDNGIVKTNITGELNAVALQKDNKIVVAGYNKYNATDTQILLMRYDEYGFLDDTFGTQGIVLTQFGSTTYHVNAVAIQEDNKIIIATTTKIANQDIIVIVRYNENGTPDESFGPPYYLGRAVLLGMSSSIAYDVAIQKDGKIIVVGTSISPYNKNQFTIIRLHEDGSPDTSFGDNGAIVITPTDNIYHNAYARSVVLDENDNIIIMGYTTDNTNGFARNYFSLVRFNQDGILDTAFGDHKTGIQNNLLTLDRLPNLSRLPAVGTIQEDKKKLVLTGSFTPVGTIPPNLWAVARYLN